MYAACRVGLQLEPNDKGLGVLGVVEADFLQPTHNKQDFDDTPAYRYLIYSATNMENQQAGCNSIFTDHGTISYVRCLCVLNNTVACCQCYEACWQSCSSNHSAPAMQQ